MTDAQKIGAYIDSVRVAKHISMAQMANDLGWSLKTFQRIAKGDVELKFSQLIAIQQYLTIDFIDMMQYADLAANVVFNAEHEIIANTDVAHPDKLAATKATIAAQYQRTPMPGLQALSLLCDVIQAELAGDNDAAGELGRQIFDLYVGYDKLTAFDFRMLGYILGYIPYERLRVLFTNLLTHRPATNWAQAADQNQLVLDSFYINLLVSALATKHLPYIREAITLIRSRDLPNSDYYFWFYRRFCRVVELCLDNAYPAAHDLYEQLLSAVAVFVPDKVLAPQRIELAARWQQLEDLHPLIDPNMKPQPPEAKA